MRVLSRVGVKIELEDTPGVYKEPEHAVRLEEVVVPNIEFDSVEVPNFSPYLGMGSVINIPDWGRAELNIKTSLYDKVGTFENFLMMSGIRLNKALEEDGNRVWTPNSFAVSTGSVDLFLSDRKYKLKGASANFKIDGKVGDKLNVNFEIKAAFEGKEMGEFDMPTPNLDDDGREIMIIRRLGGMTLDGKPLNISEFSFDLGNEINYEKFTNVGEFHISERKPKLTLKARLEKGQDEGFEAFKSGAPLKFEAIFRNAAGKDIWKLLIPMAKVSKQPNLEDSDGIFVVQNEFIAVGNKGDDNFQLIYLGDKQ